MSRPTDRSPRIRKPLVGAPVTVTIENEASAPLERVEYAETTAEALRGREMMRPLGKIANLLRDGVSYDDPDLLQALDQFRFSVKQWSGSEEVAAKITPELIDEARVHVEDGGRIIRGIAVAMVRNFSAIPEGKQDAAIDALTDSPTFASAIRSIESMNPGIPSENAHRQMAGIIKKEVEAIVLEKKFAGTDIPVWMKSPTTEEIVALRKNLYKSHGAGLTALGDRVLYAARIKVKGRPVNARQLILESLRRLSRDNVVDFRLPSDSLQDRLEASKYFYRDRAKSLGYYLVDDASPESGYRTSPLGENVSLILNAVANLKDKNVAARYKETLPEHIANLRDNLWRSLEGRFSQDPQMDARMQACISHLDEATILKYITEANKDAEALRKAENQDPHLFSAPDDFSRRQKLFTQKLFTERNEAGDSLESLIIEREKGAVKGVMASGAWRHYLVEEDIKANDPELSRTAKVARVEQFLNNIPELAKKAAGACTDCTEKERMKMILAAQAFAALTHEMEMERLKSVSAKSAGRTRAKQTDNLLTREAEAYATLMRMGMIEPLPLHTPPIPYDPEETYDERLAEAIAESKKTSAALHEKFENEMLARFTKSLRAFLDFLPGQEKTSSRKETDGTEEDTAGKGDSKRKNMSGIFIATLGFYINKSGATLIDAVHKRMQELEESPPVTQYTHDEKIDFHERLQPKPYVVYNEETGTFVQPVEQTREMLDAADEEMDRVALLLDSVSETENNPGNLRVRAYTSREPFDDGTATIIVEHLDVLREAAQALRRIDREYIQYFKASGPRGIQQRDDINTQQKDFLRNAGSYYTTRHAKLSGELSEHRLMLRIALAVTYIHDEIRNLRADIERNNELSPEDEDKMTETETRALERTIARYQRLISTPNTNTLPALRIALGEILDNGIENEDGDAREAFNTLEMLLTELEA